MPYSLMLLNTAAECDTLLRTLVVDKENLEVRKINLQHQRKNFESNSVSIAAELQATQAEIDALNSIIPGLPIGELKTDNVKKLRKAELRLFLLQDRQQNYGAIAVVEREVDIHRADQQLAALEAAMLEVTARKAEV